MNRDKWKAMRNLAEDRSIFYHIVKPAENKSCVVIWDCQDYFAEVEKQLSHTYRDLRRSDLQ